MTYYITTCSFQHAHFNEAMEEVDFFLKKLMVINSFIEKKKHKKTHICCRNTLELPLLGNSNVYQQHMLMKIKKTILKFTVTKYGISLCPF